MPTVPPPPPPAPTIQHFITLDDRLGAAAVGVEVPDEPGRTVSASLAHVPSRLNIWYGRNDSGAQLLELAFTYLDGNDEPRNPSRVSESGGRYGVDMEVGGRSGRIYRLIMRGVDLSDESVGAVTDGIRACFLAYVEQHAAPLRQQAILRSLATLVQTILPGLAKQISAAVGGR